MGMPAKRQLTKRLLVAFLSQRNSSQCFVEKKYYGEKHRSQCNLSKCHQLFLSKQSIYFLAFYVMHGATSILDGLVYVGNLCGINELKWPEELRRYAPTKIWPYWHLIFDIWHLTFDIWDLTFDIQSMDQWTLDILLWLLWHNLHWCCLSDLEWLLKHQLHSHGLSENLKKVLWEKVFQ